MPSLIGGYEDSDEDDDAPSILATQAAQAAATAAGQITEPTTSTIVAADLQASGAAATAPAPANATAASPLVGSLPDSCNASNDSTGGGGGVIGGIARVVMASPLAGNSSPSSDGAVSPACESNPEEESANMEEVLLPPSPLGEPDPELLERVRLLHDLRKRGKSIRDHIQSSRDWSNPYVLERVIKVFELDEHGSNYPKQLFDSCNVAEHPSDYYDAPECERPPLPKRLRKIRDEAHRTAEASLRWNGAGSRAPLNACAEEGSLVT
eukprot:TRINITY_DN70484_c0_g1_i1.p1 TRINITY_DN70484_c0_g1~~TRINITY_DN70484_c0_g1_i1.p1  ORF type:complete len:267 (+),score=47.84 TRINITY_DN70484_c0_g1_i1:94-894(+)